LNRSPLSILLAVLIAFQSCLAGLTLCTNGGCCHVEFNVEPAHGECGHDKSHDHSVFVHAEQTHPCNCTDVVIDPGDAIGGKRSEWSMPAPTPLAVANLSFDIVRRVPLSVEIPNPRARGDTSQDQRLAVVRATRLLL
jgi:hypothetical protein